MRAAAYTSLGESGTIESITLDDPEPDPGRRSCVEACSVNHRDLWNLGGAWGVTQADLPYVGGSDVAGVVETIGDGVDAVAAGDRVVLNPVESCGTCRFCRDGTENRCENFGIFDGGFAELARVDATRLVHVPDGVDLVDAAAIPIAYMTAYHMTRRADVEPGDLAFVPGATGGVGVAAIQLLDAVGARSIATSTSAEKLEHLTDSVRTTRSSPPTSRRSARASRVSGRWMSPSTTSAASTPRSGSRYSTVAGGWSSAGERSPDSPRSTFATSTGTTSASSGARWGRRRTSRVSSTCLRTASSNPPSAGRTRSRTPSTRSRLSATGRRSGSR